MVRKTLALLIRALRVDARNFRPHMMRFGLVALMLYLLWISQESSRFMGAPGLMLFRSIAYANVWFITIVGVTYFASAVTEEKEERTLGLLKMADVGALSILLGKWLPRVLGMLSLLAVQFPFTLLAVTLGGVTIRQVTAAYVALLVYLVYVGVVSLFGSVVCSTTGAACRVAFLILFVRSFVGWIMVGVASAPVISPGLKSLLGPGGEFLATATVSALLGRALETTFSETLAPIPLWTMVGETAAFFVAALALFEPCTKTEVALAANTPLLQRILPRRKGKRVRAWEWALVGKDYHFLSGGAIRTGLRFVLYLIIAVGLPWLTSWLYSGQMRANDFGFYAIWLGLLFLAFEMLMTAARVFRSEIQEQTWSSLVMLPRSLTNVSWSKIAGCVLSWWPAAATISLGFLLVPDAFTELINGIISDPTAVLATILVLLQIALILELTTWFSISMTWAAWPLAAPLAVSAVMLINILVGTCLLTGNIGGSGVAEGLLFIIDCLAFTAVGGLYVAIGRRLAQRGSDGT